MCVCDEGKWCESKSERKNSYYQGADAWKVGHTRTPPRVQIHNELTPILALPWNVVQQLPGRPPTQATIPPCRARVAATPAAPHAAVRVRLRVMHAHRACGRPCKGLGRVSPHPFRRDALRRFRRVDALGQARGRLERGRERRLDLTRELAHEHRIVLLAQLRDDVVDPVPLDKYRTIRVDVADRAQDAQQVEAHDGLARAELVDEPLEELRFGDANGNVRRYTEDLEERVEEVFEGVRLRLNEAPEEGV